MIDWSKSVSDFDVGTSGDGLSYVVFGMRDGLLEAETSRQESSYGRGESAASAVSVLSGNSGSRK